MRYKVTVVQQMVAPWRQVVVSVEAGSGPEAREKALQRIAEREGGAWGVLRTDRTGVGA